MWAPGLARSFSFKIVRANEQLDQLEIRLNRDTRPHCGIDDQPLALTDSPIRHSRVGIDNSNS